MIYEIGIQQVSKRLECIWLEIRGKVIVENQPARKRIAILDRFNMNRIAMCYSDPLTGKFCWRAQPVGFHVYALNRLLAIALDDTKVFNAQIYDYLTPHFVKAVIEE